MKIHRNMSEQQLLNLANDALDRIEKLERKVADLEQKVKALYGGPASQGA